VPGCYHGQQCLNGKHALLLLLFDFWEIDHKRLPFAYMVGKHPSKDNNDSLRRNLPYPRF
ncbi:hypothetical protein, partial [Bilophila wadsworthia]|uniref:hypothetical protein n=1 Tax=Bilophila wadsworthia TaxID=35833 RepID=UPI003AB43730